jgi:hypothetical protein
MHAYPQPDRQPNQGFSSIKKRSQSDLIYSGSRLTRVVSSSLLFGGLIGASFAAAPQRAWAEPAPNQTLIAQEIVDGVPPPPPGALGQATAVAAGPTQAAGVPSATSAQNYMVLVNGDSQLLLSQVQRVQPAASLTDYGGRRYIQAGVFGDSTKAEQQLSSLASLGIGAEVVSLTESSAASSSSISPPPTSMTVAQNSYYGAPPSYSGSPASTGYPSSSGYAAPPSTYPGSSGYAAPAAPSTYPNYPSSSPTPVPVQGGTMPVPDPYAGSSYANPPSVTVPQATSATTTPNVPPPSNLLPTTPVPEVEFGQPPAPDQFNGTGQPVPPTAPSDAGAGERVKHAYYVVIPGTAGNLTSISNQVTRLGEGVGISQLVQVSDRPRGPHVQVGPFTDRTAARRWSSYFRDFGMDARVYYSR